MRKLVLNLILAAAAVIAFSSCQKEEGTAGGGELQQITVKLPAMPQTRAAIADYGSGSNVNRCIMQIYREGQPYGPQQVSAIADKQATFNLRLVPSQVYDFVFWADCATADGSGNFTDKSYVTSNLAAITVNGAYRGNNDEMDAFFCTLEDYKVEGPFTEELTLKRPFGMLNIKTNDLASISAENLKPTAVKVAFAGIPVSFNALTGEAGDVKKVEYTADIINAATGELTVDYIWAAEDEAALADFSVEFLNNTTSITVNGNFKSVPIRRNYKTNVSGNLLTKEGNFEVTVNPAFEKQEYDNAYGVQTVAEIADALKAGETNIVVAEAPAGDVEIIIPNCFADAATEISIIVPASDKKITLKEGNSDGANLPAVVNLDASTTGTLVLDMPNTTVYLSGSYGSVEASTADDTLVVSEGTAIGNLTVNKGGVEIYGTVENLVLGSDAFVKVYSVGDAQLLREAFDLAEENKCARILLTADIDLEGSEGNMWEPVNTENTRFEELDGAGYTISNLYADNYTGHADGAGYYYGGLFYVLQGNVKSLTLENAEVICHRGGALVGRMDWGSIENCKVLNATVKGEQKLGGLIGFVNTSSKDISVKGSSVENCTINPLISSGLYQAGGLIGYLQTFDRNVLVEGCSVSSITLGKVYDPTPDVVDRIYDLEQYYSHAFIGDIVNISTDADAYDKYTVELKDNSVDAQITGIPTCNTTNEYTGWWAGDYNTAGYSYSTKLIIDGVTQDRWVEVKRVANLLSSGGKVYIWRDYDLSSCSELPDAIYIEKPTVIYLGSEKNADVTLTVDRQWLHNKSRLEIYGPGTMKASAYTIYNEQGGELIIHGGVFTTTYSGLYPCVIYNTGGTCTIEGGEFDSPGLTFMNLNGAQMTINGGNIKTSGVSDSYAIAAIQKNTDVTLNGGRIEGVYVVNGANMTITDGTIVNKHKYYAVYSGRDGSYYDYGTVTIYGGYFCGAEEYPDIYCTNAEDVTVMGGYFRDNKATLADGYTYQSNVQEIDGITYNYKVVLQL